MSGNSALTIASILLSRSGSPIGNVQTLDFTGSGVEVRMTGRGTATVFVVGVDPDSPGWEIGGIVAFDAMTTTLVLPRGDKTVFEEVVVCVTTPFGSGATIHVGLGQAPAAFLDVIATQVGQFEAQELRKLDASDVVLLSVNPGSSAQGEGFLVYRMC